MVVLNLMDGNKYRITLCVVATNESSVMDSKMLEIGAESKQPLNYKIIYDYNYNSFLATTKMDSSWTVIFTSKVLKLMTIILY